MKYMVGEEFFKNTDSSDDLNDADDDLDEDAALHHQQLVAQALQIENEFCVKHPPD